MQLGVRIDPANPRLDLAQLGVVHEVGLVDEDDVGERDLVLGFGGVFQAIFQPLRVGDGDDGVEFGLSPDILVDEEGLRHRRGIGQTRCFHDDGVELSFSTHR